MAFPTQNNLLVPYSTNFNDRIVASHETFNLTFDQAAAYTPLHQAYVGGVDAVGVALAAGTRSQSLLDARDLAKNALLVYGRQLYSFVQASLNVTDADKRLLGVRVRDAQPTPSPAITVRPGVDVVSVSGKVVTVNIHDTESATKRGRAPGAVAAWVYSFVGTEYPADPAAWTFHGASRRGLFDVRFADNVPAGAQVWVCAMWLSRLQEPGPVSLPVSAHLQYGGMAKAA